MPKHILRRNGISTHINKLIFAHLTELSLHAISLRKLLDLQEEVCSSDLCSAETCIFLTQPESQQ